MNFESLLQQIENPGTEKTAGAPPAEGGKDTALQQALKATLEKVGSQSSPAAESASGDPIDDLMKLAGDMAQTEKDAEILHAAKMGRAFADACQESLAAADAKCASVGIEAAAAPIMPALPILSGNADVEALTKQAAEQGYQDTQERLFVEKVATVDNPGMHDALIKEATDAGREDLLVKAAAEVGYRETHEKIAATQFALGQEDALQEVHNVLTQEFLKGAAEVQLMVELAKQQTAAVR
jgi:hypothetical protein